MTLFWLVLFVILALFELATVNLVSIWFAIGAIIATFVSLVTIRISIDTSCCFYYNINSFITFNKTIC